MGTVIGLHRSKPGIFNLIHTVGVVKPEILKPENIDFGDVGANPNLAWQMIGVGFSKRKDHGHGKLKKRTNQSAPVGGLLHVAPSVVSPLNRQLNQA
jgi:hypothetical protein